MTTGVHHCYLWGARPQQLEEPFLSSSGYKPAFLDVKLCCHCVSPIPQSLGMRRISFDGWSALLPTVFLCSEVLTPRNKGQAPGEALIYSKRDKNSSYS